MFRLNIGILILDVKDNFKSDLKAQSLVEDGVYRLYAMSRWIGTVHKGTALPLVQSSLNIMVTGEGGFTTRRNRSVNGGTVFLNLRGLGKLT